jgi:hypothetical protein
LLVVLISNIHIRFVVLQYPVDCLSRIALWYQNHFKFKVQSGNRFAQHPKKKGVISVGFCWFDIFKILLHGQCPDYFTFYLIENLDYRFRGFNFIWF